MPMLPFYEHKMLETTHGKNSPVSGEDCLLMFCVRVFVGILEYYWRNTDVAICLGWQIAQI